MWNGSWKLGHIIARFLTRSFDLVQDCDMPDDLKMPGNRHAEDVDVMEFLNLKRAASVDDKADEGGISP